MRVLREDCARYRGRSALGGGSHYGAAREPHMRVYTFYGLDHGSALNGTAFVCLVQQLLYCILFRYPKHTILSGVCPVSLTYLHMA